MFFFKRHIVDAAVTCLCPPGYRGNKCETPEIDEITGKEIIFFSSIYSTFVLSLSNTTYCNDKIFIILFIMSSIVFELTYKQ